MQPLIQAIQHLSMARDLESVMAIVRDAARALTGADGATFVLRDGDCCLYAAENAISPLWKGQRFPLESCISGWVMQHREPVVIEDIYADPRIPADLYRPTFVHSLAMVPIRTLDPLGAIGNYWAGHHRPTAQQVAVLGALADSTAIAIENVQVYETLRRKARELEATNRDLESFAYSVAHDLRTPLRAINGYAQIAGENLAPHLDQESGYALDRIRYNANLMASLLDDLLLFARAGLVRTGSEVVATAALVEQVIGSLTLPRTAFQLELRADLRGDRALLAAAVGALLDNAVKFTAPRAQPQIRIGCRREGDEIVFSVQDNGIGFEPRYAERIFRLFERLHSGSEYAGTGVGLALAQRIVQSHGGRIWAESRVGEGALVSFALPA